ncbi:TetR/AcrR family transcriptional regulator C-terminal ligand-binding domain-containing protein [Actinoplanes sp. LDG1-06]|uniref:TetR/AcrR family transcriptional regulator C-terminal ligand-binding domain-containing protein n=1 Tax=Paractinoplanes ovalisporus TaxID=2810368 RepID=A0ABS2ANU1_9ACTN|nr:TetR/AcrR family transcriptional regulator [Actinoplanes ovalisporus]MBM2620869.1 TetR/AcrR family transcriptional regulator C-terminal ligand-binding domain-containing protein [Actinoplanes ovalisporus]
MQSEAATPRRGRGRRPAAEVRASVLRAAADLLLGEGIKAVTFDRVATAAGSSKMTLYKWWPSAGALAAEAFFAHSEQQLEFPDTGDIRADITTQLRAFVRLLTHDGTGTVIAGLIGNAQTDPELSAAFSRHYSAPRRALAVAAFEKARDRGQLRDDIDLGILVDQLWGACYNRLLVPDAPLTEEYAVALVANVLDGAAPR